MKNTIHALTAIFCGILVLPLAGRADTSFTINTTTADAFLSGTSPTLNFGSAGTLAISPAGSPKGEFDSVIKFNTAAAISQFNATYGAGNWQVTGLKLQLASNFATQGSQPNNPIFNVINAGSFGIDWLAGDAWTEGTGGGMGSPGYPGNSSVSFNSIQNLLSPGYDSLGTYTYTPPGNTGYINYLLPLDANLVSDAAAGGDLSLYFYAADNQVGYLFNSKEFSSNHPGLSLSATAVPEPGFIISATLALGALLMMKGRTEKP
jgi:hypothetical protein